MREILTCDKKIFLYFKDSNKKLYQIKAYLGSPWKMLSDFGLFVKIVRDSNQKQLLGDGSVETVLLKESQNS